MVGSERLAVVRCVLWWTISPGQLNTIMASVAEQVKAIIVEKLGVDLEEVVDSANFSNDLGADSLDIVELVMDFEKAFDIEISDEDAGDNISTVGDAIKFIEEKVNSK